MINPYSFAITETFGFETFVDNQLQYKISQFNGNLVVQNLVPYNMQDLSL